MNNDTTPTDKLIFFYHKRGSRLNGLVTLSRFERKMKLMTEMIKKIHQEVFGPGRLTRTAYRIREGYTHSLNLSFVAELDSNLIASVRLTPIFIGSTPGLLLGPLAVSSKFKNLGIGKDLLQQSVNHSTQAGEQVILLVGTEQYYGPIGFRVMNSSLIRMPGPVDPAKLLITNLKNDPDLELSGLVRGRKI